MTDADFIKVLISFAAGSLLTLLGAWTNHRLSTRRWEAEVRSAEVSYLREFCDTWVDLTMRKAELEGPVSATALPADPSRIQAAQLSELQQLSDAYKSLRPAVKRAPEPLTDHLRLFLIRMARAGNAVPYDIEFTKVALVEFRSALNQYVRRGKTRGVSLFPNESAEEYERLAARIGMPGLR